MARAPKRPAIPLCPSVRPPPSALPGISPSRGEIGAPHRPALRHPPKARPPDTHPATNHPTPGHRPISAGAHQILGPSSPAIRQAGNAASGQSPPLRGRCRRSRQRGGGHRRPPSPCASCPPRLWHKLPLTLRHFAKGEASKHPTIPPSALPGISPSRGEIDARHRPARRQPPEARPPTTRRRPINPSLRRRQSLRQAGNAASGRSPPLRGRCRRSRQRGVTACDHRENRGSPRPFPQQKQRTAAEVFPAPAPGPILSPSRHRLHRFALPARRDRCPGGAVKTRAAFPGPGMKGLPLA